MAAIGVSFHSSSKPVTGSKSSTSNEANRSDARLHRDEAPSAFAVLFGPILEWSNAAGD